MIRRVSVLLLSAAFAAVIPASADVLTIGTSGAPTVFTRSSLGNPSGIWDSGQQSFSLADGTHGTYEEDLAPVPNNPFCSGCLGFGLQVQLDANSPYDLATVRFGQWNSQTDVGYCNDCSGISNQVIPDSVFRGFGNYVGFNFSGNTLAPGDTSTLLVVLTDATQFWVRGGVVFNDTNNYAMSSQFFDIAVPTPEPATIALAGMALLGLVVRRRLTR